MIWDWDQGDISLPLLLIYGAKLVGDKRADGEVTS